MFSLNQVPSHHPLVQVPLQTFQLDGVLSFSSSPEEGSPEEASQEAGVDQNKQTNAKPFRSVCTFYRKPAVYLRLLPERKLKYQVQVTILYQFKFSLILFYGEV